MKFNNLVNFTVKVQNNVEKKEEKTVRTQRSQCRTTHKRQDC